MIHLKAPDLPGFVTINGSACNHKEAGQGHNYIVSSREFATLPDEARCPDCAWHLRDAASFGGHDVDTFHLLVEVERGRNTRLVTTLCGHTTGINEVEEFHFANLPEERQCPRCREILEQRGRNAR
jgi:rubredoxin